jgi:hypothetical protein
MSEVEVERLMGSDRVRTLGFLNDDLLPRAVRRMNRDALPARLAVFDSDPLPSNQRNLTDVRTRVGNLLEWELGIAISAELAPFTAERLRLAYVVSNRFPDFEFRTSEGLRGVRIEVKAVDLVAEEKAANFDTLIKDIRTGQDYVVVMVWRFHRPERAAFRHPFVENVIALDAEHLAKMRDTYWLNTPPKSAEDARQGFDLRYPVNCSGNAFNKEEGNAGKLMRLFDPAFASLLPSEVRGCATLGHYSRLRELVLQGGFRVIAQRIGVAYRGLLETETLTGTAAHYVYCRSGQRLVVMADAEKPARKAALAAAVGYRNVCAILVLNEKFQWTAYRDDGVRLGEARKPEEAEELIRYL